MNFTYADGATPLLDEDIQGLIPKHVTNQNQLNDWEHANILLAEKWAYARKNKDILSIQFLQLLHKKMFNQTWDWAGHFRLRQTNIGIVWHQISSQLKQLCDDTNFQYINNIFSPDEICVRFHHRLVLIHAFPNGNGRHARLTANLLSIHLGQKPFSWGLNSSKENLVNTGELRSSYLAALRKADVGDIKPLMEFSRS